MKTFWFCLVLSSLVGCERPIEDTDDVPIDDPDGDGDGFVLSEDCDDSDPAISPEGIERLNGVDDDCDGSIDRVSLNQADVILEGSEYLDQAGWPLVGVGDLNGDGYPEVVIGVHGADTVGQGSGGVYVLTGGEERPESGLLKDTATFYEGESAASVTGTGASGAGDVNGDGFDDLVIGAFNYDAEQDGDALEGAVYLIHGGPDALESRSLSDADVRLVGDSNMWLGFATAPLGDVNGDGFDDFIAGAIGAKTDGKQSGGALVLLGSEEGFVSGPARDHGVWLWGDDVHEMAGSAVAGPLDLNGDGFDDVVVSAPGMTGSPGRVYIQTSLLSADQGLASSDSIFTGPSGALSGWSLDAVGDTDGDGYEDLLIGAPGVNDETGAAYVLRGSAVPADELSAEDTSLTLLGENIKDWAGGIVSRAGDVNGDGFSDLLVGAAGGDAAGSGSGRSYLILGAESGSIELRNADAIFNGTTDWEQSGVVSGPGDLDGDGYDDILVGATGHDKATGYAGRVYMIFGSPF